MSKKNEVNKTAEANETNKEQSEVLKVKTDLRAGYDRSPRMDIAGSC